MKAKHYWLLLAVISFGFKFIVFGIICLMCFILSANE